MEWISVEDALPEPGEVVITFRPMAKASGDEVYTVQKFIGKNYGNKSPQGVIHGFDRWCHPTHWARIIPPIGN